VAYGPLSKLTLSAAGSKADQNEPTGMMVG
jgi:hypothetical protein